MTRRLIALLVALALSILVALVAAGAQPPTKVYRVGSLRVGGRYQRTVRDSGRRCAGWATSQATISF
jgi:hypothetical protein